MRIVIKVGTNVLTSNSYQIQHTKVKELVGEIFELKRKHYDVILVSSGAVGSGKEKLPDLKLEHKKQVWAAVGQPVLMQLYSRYATRYNMLVAQCLLLRNDFTDKERYDNFVATIEGLLKAGVVPVINENDVVAMEDLTVGDNDLLAAMISVAVKADELILLTNQKGLYTSNPDIDPVAKLIPFVRNVDFELEKLCNYNLSSLGRGGMLSKVRAAKHAVHAGTKVCIADGRESYILSKLLIKKEKLGTVFAAQGSKEISHHHRWMMAAKSFGQLIIDDGAVKALLSGKSLLLPGIINIKGIFDAGEVVEVISKIGTAVAYGKTGYNNQDLQKTLAKRKKEIKKKITLEKEIIHCDHMVILKI